MGQAELHVHSALDTCDKPLCDLFTCEFYVWCILHHVIRKMLPLVFTSRADTNNLWCHACMTLMYVFDSERNIYLQVIQNTIADILRQLSGCTSLIIHTNIPFLFERYTPTFSFRLRFQNAGVHSGDASLLLPAQKLWVETIRRVKRVASAICKALNISGPFNIQLMAKEQDIKVKFAYFICFELSSVWIGNVDLIMQRARDVFGVMLGSFGVYCECCARKRSIMRLCCI